MRVLALESDLVFELCNVVTKNNTDLPFSMNSTRLSFNDFSSCTKKLSRCFRFPTLRRSSTCKTTMIVSLCVTPFFTKQPGSDSKRSKPNSNIVFLKVILPTPWRTLVTVQLSLYHAELPFSEFLGCYSQRIDT